MNKENVDERKRSRIGKNMNSRKYIKKEKNSKLKKVKLILIIIFILIIILAIKTGISISRWQNLAQDMIANSPSQVLDIDGKVIAELGNNKNTKNVSLKEIPDNLKNAYISIEDQRFYKHSGVDLPRTGAAIFSYIKNMGSASFGGSSITQQLVKNLTGANSSKVTRKISEWFKAFGIEGVLSKDEILEAYLNIIYVGPNIYGVGLGSEYYFNKEISELSLAECAFLAGINNSPNSYNPFGEDDYTEKINKRTKTVLSKMLELEYINETDYNQAIAQVDKGLKFKQGKIETNKNSGIYSYHTDALITQIIEDIAKKKHISETFATNYINMANLKIYSTQDSNIQKEIESEFSKSTYKLKSSNDPSITSQAAMVIIDHTTGEVKGCVGGLGEKTTARGFNRATQALRQTGSSSKPISVLLPGIDNKIFTPSTKYIDEETTFNDGTEEGYSPTDYNKYRGEITVRQAVESSQNIPFVKMMEQITPKSSISYMEKLGITTLTKTDDNLNLALGGLDKGISPLEMATAYATIANDGVYIEPTFYTKIENGSGKKVIKTKQKRKKVCSASVAYIVKSLLTEPVTGTKGTANYCKISGIDVAAKTGTTNDEYDRWLCGFTPYYTAVTWFGFDKNETIHFNKKNPSGLIWSNVMKKIHTGLANAKFEIPNSKDLVSVQICKTTGLIINDNCPDSYLEYYLIGTEPQDYCSKHSNTKTNKTNSIQNENKQSDKDKNLNTKQNIINEDYNTNINKDQINENNTNITEEENNNILDIENSVTNIEDIDEILPDENEEADNDDNDVTNNIDDEFEQ